jgi:hypothetical protein
MEIYRGARIPAGVYVDSTMRCIDCGTYLTHAQEGYVVRFRDCDERQCRGCGKKLLHLTGQITDIHPASEHLLDATTAKEATWYHATNRKNWMTDLLDYDVSDGFPLVHVGILDAAINIMDDQYVGSDNWIYLYKVKLASTAVLDAELYEDENKWPVRTTNINDTGSNAFRYVNRYEATGSISLLVDPRELIIESVEKLTPEQAGSMVRQLEVFGYSMV